MFLQHQKKQNLIQEKLFILLENRKSSFSKSYVIQFLSANISTIKYKSYNGHSPENILSVEKIKEIYRMSKIEDLYNIPQNMTFKEWLDKLFVDPADKSLEHFPRDIPAIFQYLKKIKIEYTDISGQNIKKILCPIFTKQGDIRKNLIF